MSAEAKRARAERRAADRDVLVGDVLAAAEDRAAVGDTEPATVHAVALVPEEGGFRLVQLSLTPSMAEACAVKVTQPETLEFQIPMAMALLDDIAKGTAPDGTPRARVCPTCGAPALVRHPSKPVDLCTACNARHEVSA